MANKTDIVLPIMCIDLTVFSNDEIRRYSVARKNPKGLDVPETIDKGEPVIGGVLDPRLGTTNMNRDCNTCGLDSEGCPCHMGHIKLPEEVYNERFIQYTRKILSCICYNCSKIPIEYNNPAFQNILKNTSKAKRLEAIKNLTAGIKLCPFCSSQKPKIKKDLKKADSKDGGSERLYKEFLIKASKGDDGPVEIDNKTHSGIITANEAFHKLENISDQTTFDLGIDANKFKLKDLIIQNYPISALAIRPSVKVDYLAEGTSEDELSKKLLDIVKQCVRLESLINNPEKKIDDKKIDSYVQLLQHNISLYANGDTKGGNDNKGGTKILKSISERIQGKEGRLRHDLEGKRTNFCARTVISADPNLSISEAGIPLRIAKTLTIPVTVTKENINTLTKYVRNGRDNYPGANYLFPKSNKITGKKIFIDLKQKNYVKLHIGDVVERHLLENDPVLFNRQPSLHKLSFLCHRARIISDPTISVFRLNVNVTTPYSADFDGDEMNMYVGQAVQCLIEYMMLANVDRHIISPRYSNPIISFKQDTPAGIYMMTEKEQMIDYHEAMNIAANIEGLDPTILKKESISTYKLFSLIIPNKINHVQWKDGKKVIEIVNGELLYGKISGSYLKDVLIMLIWDRYGPKETRKFIDNAQRIAELYLYHKGMSIGYRDCIPSPEIFKMAKEVIHDKLHEISKMITEIENNPKLLDYDLFEDSVARSVGVIKTSVAAKTIKMLDSSNNFFLLVDSKAKGSNENIGAILAGKGQELVKFGRIEKAVNGRTLPHFCFNDDTAQARGYIINSYYEGMDPFEYWFYHQGGREGIINTAIKTAEAGYQQRRLIKALESILVANDGTIRTSNGVVLQLLYGDNQLDQTMQRRVEFRSIKMDNKEMEKIFKLSTDDLKKYDSKVAKLNEKYFNEIINMRNQMRIIQLRVKLNFGLIDNVFFQPASFIRIINDTINTIDSDNELVNPLYVYETIHKILEHENTTLIYYHNKDKNPIKYEDEQRFKFLFKYALYEYLAPKRCIKEYKLNKTKLNIIADEIIQSFKKSVVQAGEMVGIVSAQSLGEPLTQMVISSFHKSGSGNKGLKGTPRLKEILGNGKNIAIPMMKIYLKEEFRTDKELAHKIGANLKFTNCKDIVKKIVTIYDPENSYSEKDKMDIKSVFSVSMSNVNLKSLSWLFRLSLDREKILDYNITMLDVKMKFLSFYEELTEDKKLKTLISQINNICILTTDINAPEPYIHIRMELNNIDNKTLIEMRNLILNRFHIKGTDKIKTIEEISNDVLLTFDDNTGEIINNKEYTIYTIGINFDKIREIPYIDQNRVMCNDIRIINNLFGIEAARTIIMKEIDEIFSSEMNHHHMAMVCDLMTHTGEITSIDRFGLNKLNIGVLSRASFEKTMELLTDAAIFNHSDHLKNVSSSIMLGKPFKGGTGLCSISMDNEVLEKSEFLDIDITAKTQISLSKMSIIEDIIKKKDNKNLFIPQFE